MASELCAKPGLDRPPAERTVIALARALRNASFYDPSHRVVQQMIGEFMAELEAVLAERRELVVKCISGYVAADDRPILGQAAAVGHLAGACHRRKVEVVSFRRGVRMRDVERFLALLTRDCAEIERAGGMRAAMDIEGIQHIVVERLTERKASDWRWLQACAIDALRTAAAEVRADRTIDVAGVQMTVREIVDDILDQRAVLHNLNSVKGMDEYTFVHALDICVFAVELGRQLNLGRRELEELGVATLLHDLGKIFVPLEILRKPGPLDSREFIIMSRHPADGAALLVSQPGVPEAAPLVAFEHHLHLDHSGYPRVRRRRSLHLYSLMAAIADVYDALTTARPYRPPLPPLEAIAVMRKEYARRLEPRLVERFLRMLGPYPSGTVLGLPGDRLALVTRPNGAEPDSPLCRLVELSAGRPRLSPAELPLRDLVADPSQVTVLDPVPLGLDIPSMLHDAAGLPPELAAQLA